MKSITGITRGCGKREIGGLYICCGFSPYGKPLEYFIIDPPVPVEHKNFRTPIWVGDDLLIWIGAEHYEFPSDFIEETRMFGVSRRVPSNFEIQRVKPTTKMFFVHGKAVVTNYSELPPPIHCPRSIPEHLEGADCCIGLSYSLAPQNNGEKKLRTVGDTSYEVYLFHTSVKPAFSQGVFLALPVTHFDLVVGENPTEELMQYGERLKSLSHVPVNFEKE